MIFSIALLDQLGREIADLLASGCPLLLSGPMGVGKTTLARFIISALCPQETVIPSPSFPIMLPYPGHLWHIDLYRIKDEAEVLALGLPEVMAKDKCIIEWPERLGKHKPPHFWEGRLFFTKKEDERRLLLNKINL